jgi:multisubunit Na+/H+ antiporter MnhE subunit
MKRPHSLAAALLWGGLALVLLPVALVCLFLMVALIVASPIAGVIFGAIVLAIGRAVLGAKKGSPE